MQRRGELIRDVLPRNIMAYAAEVGAALGSFGSDLDANGRDATGRKSQVPWARFFSRSKSPKATSGWYVVYLFHPDGGGVSLCLSHGSTTFDGSVYRDRSPTEVANLMNWGQKIVGGDFVASPEIRAGVNLGGKGKLARSYERTTLFSKFYVASAIPDETALASDLVLFAQSLRKLYEGEELGLSPGSSGIDVVEAIDIIDEIASPLKNNRRGQGRNLSPEARRAVELRAMHVAKLWLKAEGFTHIKDVSSTESCDFRARKNGKGWFIEVKGTTGGAASILLTRREVALHLKQHPLNALLVVHGIRLTAMPIAANEGTLLSICPWEVDEDALSPTCYEYRLG